MLRNSKWPKKTAQCKVRVGGFTLIELLVTLAISSIVLAAIGSVYAGLTRSYTTQNVAADVQQTLRAGIDFVVEDIMLAGLDPLGTGRFKFEAASIDSMMITSDRNMNGELDSFDFENITYRYTDGMLLQCLYLPMPLVVGDCVASPDTLLIDNVTDLTFRYLDAGDSETADLEDIRTVEISMTVTEWAGRGGTVERTYTTRVSCRNLSL